VLMHVESLAQGGMLSTCSERVSHCDYHKKKNFFNLKKKKSSPFLALLAGSWDSQFLSGKGWRPCYTHPTPLQAMAPPGVAEQA
jgi:hypothetical protein